MRIRHSDANKSYHATEHRRQPHPLQLPMSLLVPNWLYRRNSRFGDVDDLLMVARELARRMPPSWKKPRSTK
jgi:hypothetical protein